MPNKSPTRMNYLTTDYLQPPRSARKRLTRSVSPSPRGSVSFEDGTVPGMLPELRKAVSAKSLHMFDGNSSSDSSPNNSLKLHKSTESLCFGMTKKRFHRRTHVLSDGEFRVRSNTDPISKFPKRREWKLPIISIPERDVYTITPATPTNAAPRRRSVVEAGGALGSLIQQTLKVTTASMGLKSTEKKDRLTQVPPRSTHEDVKSKFSRSTSSVSALGYNTTTTTATTQADDSTSMAPLQCHIHDDDAQSVTTTTTATTALENIAADKILQQQQQQQQQSQKKRIFYQQLSTSGASTQSGYSSANSSFNESYQNLTTLERNQKQEHRSLKAQSSGSLNPLASVASSASLRSLSPSRKSVSSNGSNTAKHEQQSTAAATAAATSNAANATAAVVASEKEKKRKEMSSSRVKKFQRHFTQVSKDEKLINYFSCALVSDILLQGHLYITDQHFAFYSNVFGYVTKVVIPTSAVTKISKEKTAKIIPNAVGVATADERHVFGSFISREAAFRLMCSVCPPLAPAEILPKAPTDVETFEEYSIEDDSSCSISGNESPPQLLDGSAAAAGGGAIVTDSGQTLLRRTTASSSLNIADSKRPISDKQQRHSDIPANAKNSLITNSTSNQSSHSHSTASSSPSSTQYANSNNNKSNISPVNHMNANSNNNNKNNFTHDSKMNGTSENASIGGNNSLTMIIGGTASSTTSTTSASATSTPSTTSSSPATTVMASTPPKSVAQAASDNLRSLSKQALMRLKFPTELNVVYVGMLLTFVLGLFSVFLLFRILSIEAKTSLYHSPVDFNWRSGNDDDIFAEALRWQKELQTKSTEEAQTILNTNLEQIAKVRRSLETLSMLIHDRSSAYGNAQRDDSD